MKLMSTEKFLTWAAERGIGPDPKYPHSVSLSYPSDVGTWYRYRYSPTSQSAQAFVDLALRTAAAGSHLWLFPPGRGKWYSTASNQVASLADLQSIIREQGVPAEYAGAIGYDPAELQTASALMVGALQHAGSLWELCAVPDHARCVLQSDEDDDLLGYFPTDAACESFTHALRHAGWQELTEPDPRVSETDPWLSL
jgi:hypothetical protein